MKQMQWDVFVSHASADKKAVADPLVRALKDAGLRVWYDRIELQLGDSLRQRIDEGLAYSRFGIVVLSPSFFAKHWPKQELNGLAQREVDGQKVILPIWYDITAEQVRRQSPMLADRIAARWSDGLESVTAAILAVIGDAGEESQNRKPRGMPALPVPVPVPQVGTDYSSLVLIATAQGKNLFVHAERIESADTLKLDLVPANPRERAFLAEFADQRRDQIYVAYDVIAVSGRMESISHTRADGKEHWKLDVQPEEPSWAMEVAFNNYSADQIAEMRARRILLGEKLPKAGRGSADTREMFEVFVRGQSATIEVPRSPLPALHANLKNDIPRFLAAARLLAVLWLHLSGTVEHIFELELKMRGDRELVVRFEGQRHRQYSNVDPAMIRVEGVCKLG